MAGVYIHIPFCGKLCTYCDFHFSTSLKDSNSMVDAIIKELELRQEYLKDDVIKTLYFGGGTPTILPSEQLARIAAKVSELWNIDLEEFTVEANPEDLSEEYLQSLKKIGVNRLSIGIQSFDDKILSFMNRRHTAQKGYQSVIKAKEAGFKNITIDLIYGIDIMSDEIWRDSIDKAISLDIQHLSCYHLTISKGSVLEHRLKKGEIKEVEEHTSQKDFDILNSIAKQHGFIHYEVSNFAKEGFTSKHNSSYWNGTPYIGIGPSAHSYNKEQRSWNISNNRKYIEEISKGILPSESETLNNEQRYNEYIMTTLRTVYGTEIETLNQFGQEIVSHFKQEAERLIKTGKLQKENRRVFILESDFLISDYIISQLFI